MTESYPLWVHVLRVVVAFGFFLTATGLTIFIERRVVARMQSRIGPNRAGPFGSLQSLFDGIKLFFKEDVTPGMVSQPLYTLAPLVSALVAFLSFAVVPLAGTVTIGGETFPLQVADVNVGILFFLAMGSINVYGIVIAGWASQSPYPLMGGVRSSAQMISYEIAQGLAVAAVFVYAGTLKVSEIVGIQQNADFALGGLDISGIPNWFVIPLFPAFVIFFIGMVAETQRPPFDLPEAEGELVGGFNTEYSGARFMLFFLAEFMNVITVSAIAVTMFFGGTAGPVFGPSWMQTLVLPLFWFLVKLGGFVFVFILLRGALPRMRYDKLMDLGWKVLIPVGLVWVLATATFQVAADQGGNYRGPLVVGGIVLAALVWFLAPLFGGDDEAGGRPAVLDDTEGDLGDVPGGTALAVSGSHHADHDFHDDRKDL